MHITSYVYDTFASPNEQEQEITWEDVDELEALLKESEPSVREIELNSAGGDIEAAFYMADLIIDFELNTNVNGTCESACTLILLAGETRMSGRTALGLKHTISPIGTQHPTSKTILNETKTIPMRVDAFEFASWLYGDRQQNGLRNLQYFVEWR